MVEYSIKCRKTRWRLSRTVGSIVGAAHGMREIKVKLWDVTFPKFWCREFWSFWMLCGAAWLTDTDISNESTASIYKGWGALELSTVLPPGNVFPLSSACQAGGPQSRSGCFEEEENLLPVTRKGPATLSRLFRANSFQIKQETCIYNFTHTTGMTLLKETCRLLITSYELENPN